MSASQQTGLRLVGRGRLIVLIDGEHHPAAVHDALSELAAEAEVVSVVFCGGGEKVAPAVLAEPEQHYGYLLIRRDNAIEGLRRALDNVSADAVFDLADEPVVPLSEKLRLAAMALAEGVAYEAPGMTLRPMITSEVEFGGPKIAVIGTGKRTGKTAVCGHLAVLLKQRGVSPAIVSMGRGGPAAPQVAEPDTGLAELLALSRRGVHAASDYLEDAVLSGVPTVGCRRVGGGPAGDTAFTNFPEGAELAARIDGVDALLFEGSGATVPPVAADRTICVAGSVEQIDALAGPLRLIHADLVLAHAAQPATVEAAKRWAGGRVIPFELEPVVAEPLPGDAIAAFFSTGAASVTGVEPRVTSVNLARREQLEHDLDAAAAAGCTHYLTEIKAAAIDMVAQHAERVGAEVVFVRNRPVGFDADLDAALIELYDSASASQTGTHAGG
ncbi:MAG: hypothetical protein HY827_06175 [Actinobacteria bacterium]|nr:hypothetical protein [Actinomycetota bacterium]